MTDLASATHRRDAEPEDLVASFDAYRGELTAYCYRMLGSPFEAEDAVQETMVRAWRGHDRFEGRSTLRSWLYRIATNVCLDQLRGRGRRARPVDLTAPWSAHSTLPAPLPEATWVLPIPDARVSVANATDDPGDAAVARESIRLAFVAALQHLPPRQRAVLVLRDVMRWRSSEVATLLDVTEVTVKSLLQRARSTMASHAADVGDEGSARASGRTGAATISDEQRALLDRYVAAFERYDVDELVRLLRDDATLSMPPHPLWLHGSRSIEAWWCREGTACAGSRTVRVTANGVPALAQYRPTSPGRPAEAFAVQLITMDGDRISAVDVFLEPALFRLFDLPQTLPASDGAESEGGRPDRG